MVRNNTRGSLPAWEKPVDQGSNPCVPTASSENRSARSRTQPSTFPLVVDRFVNPKKPQGGSVAPILPSSLPQVRNFSGNGLESILGESSDMSATTPAAMMNRLPI